MLRIFCALTGDDYKLASVETPASRKKISVLGSVMLIPVLMWFIIASSIMHSMFEVSMRYSLLTGLIAALIIFILERAIVMTGNNNFVTCFRVIIGFVIASLGAIFMDELIFEKDIVQQQYNERTDKVESERLKIDSVYGPQVAALQSTLDITRNSWLVTAEDARKEADGTGGSGRKGISAITKLKLEQAATLKSQLDRMDSEIKALNLEWKNKYEVAESTVSTNLHGKSILARISSLFNLVFSDWVAGITYLFFTIFLFSLEFIVIIMKYAMPETSYERRVAAMEQVSKRRMDRMMDYGINSFDPGDNTEMVKRLELELKKPVPTLFKGKLQNSEVLN